MLIDWQCYGVFNKLDIADTNDNAKRLIHDTKILKSPKTLTLKMGRGGGYTGCFIPTTNQVSQTQLFGCRFLKINFLVNHFIVYKLKNTRNIKVFCPNTRHKPLYIPMRLSVK